VLSTPTKRLLDIKGVRCVRFSAQRRRLLRVRNSGAPRSPRAQLGRLTPPRSAASAQLGRRAAAARNSGASPRPGPPPPPPPAPLRSDAKLEKIMEACKRLKPCGYTSGSEALLASKARVRITSGSAQLDAILGGGFECGSITELFGEFRTGKTQLCSHLCVTAQLSREHGGGAGKVVVIDTENAFRVERVAEIAEKRFGLDPAAVLDNIIVGRALTHEHQCEFAAPAM
jgi:hypothetical protein